MLQSLQQPRFNGVYQFQRPAGEVVNYDLLLTVLRQADKNPEASFLEIGSGYHLSGEHRKRFERADFREFLCMFLPKKLANKLAPMNRFVQGLKPQAKDITAEYQALSKQAEAVK